MNDIHYVYKITNLKNNKIYIGVRTHPNPEQDTYMSSSNIIAKLIEIEGVKNFKKEVLHVYSTRQEAEQKEKEYLTEEFCNDPNTYNINSNSSLQGDVHGFRKDLWYDYYDTIRERYQNGEPAKELGKYYRCDTGTIRKIVEDIKRTRSETQKLRYEKYTTSGARDFEFDEKYLSEVLKLYCEDKWSVNRIAKHFNKSTAFIHTRLNENKISIRPRKENNEKAIRKLRPEVWKDEAKIVSLYKQGYTISDLIRKYKCNGGLIRQILVKHNIKIRNKTENKLLKLCQK
jgi:Mor family transcriptional regulator